MGLNILCSVLSWWYFDMVVFSTKAYLIFNFVLHVSVPKDSSPNTCLINPANGNFLNNNNNNNNNKTATETGKMSIKENKEKWTWFIIHEINIFHDLKMYHQTEHRVNI